MSSKRKFAVITGVSRGIGASLESRRHPPCGGNGGGPSATHRTLLRSCRQLAGVSQSRVALFAWHKALDRGTSDRNDRQERDQRSDAPIFLINGENHYGMRFVLSKPGASKSSFLAGFVLALVFGGECACAESPSSAPYTADAHGQICNCGSALPA